MISMMTMIMIIRSDDGRSKRQLSKCFTAVNRPVSTRLIKPNIYDYEVIVMTELITWSFNIAKRDILTTRLI